MSLHVIGLGVAQHVVLDAPALNALQSADLVFGSARQLETVASALKEDSLNANSLKGRQQTELLPKLPELERRLQQLLETRLNSDKRLPAPLIVVLASGDPLFYGIGKWLAQRFSASDLHFYPAVSSVQAACHRASWSLQDVEVLSLHGRPVDKLRSALRAGQKIAILSDAQSSPDILAQICVDCGFGESTLLVCEAMGYAYEKVTKFKASELVDAAEDTPIQFDPLHVTLIELNMQEVSAQQSFPCFPGFPDKAFITDKGEGKGMITKREVRLAILSLIQASPRDIIWDIGAGCGSVSCELAFWNANRPGSDEGQVYAIEHHPERLSCLEANRHKFGLLSAMSIVTARAEEVVASLPKPDKVFVGGSGGELEQLLMAAWGRLDIGGSLVASAVTEASKQHLLAFYQARVAASDALAETVQVAVSRGEVLAQELMYRPNLPVTLFKWVKV